MRYLYKRTSGGRKYLYVLGLVLSFLHVFNCWIFVMMTSEPEIASKLVIFFFSFGDINMLIKMIYVVNYREYIVDLMADPGTLIPPDAAGSHIEYDDTFFSSSPLSRDIDSSHIASSSSGVASSFEEQSDVGTLDKRYRFKNIASAGNQSDDTGEFREDANLIRPTTGEEESKMSSDGLKKSSNLDKVPVQELPGRSNYPYAHARSPSWTEGVSSPAAHRMKVKDVSLYMIDAAKENPQLAQKLHNVLLESGVVAPPSLFTEIYPEQLDVSTTEAKSPVEDKSNVTQQLKDQDDLGPARFLPPLPHHRMYSKPIPPCNQPEQLKPAGGLGVNLPFDTREVPEPSLSLQSELTPVKYAKNVPVAAAAAAAAAVVASSMVVAATKSSTDSNLELPVAAAATATAAAVVATTAAVNKQYEQGTQTDGDADGAGYEPRGSGGRGSGGCGSGGRGSGDQERDALEAKSEGERISDSLVGNDSSKSDVALDDVAECEIPWEEIIMGERIGLGSGLCICYKFTCFISSGNLDCTWYSCLG